jgi:hypothetical protein
MLEANKQKGEKQTKNYLYIRRCYNVKLGRNFLEGGQFLFLDYYKLQKTAQ